jgi:hypothetical protein
MLFKRERERASERERERQTDRQREKDSAIENITFHNIFAIFLSQNLRPLFHFALIACYTTKMGVVTLPEII